MDVKLIIFEIYPPVSELVNNDETLMLTILTDQTEKIIDVGDSLSNPKGSVFKTNENVIKFGLYRGKENLGLGEFNVNNEVRWVTVNNEAIKKKKESFSQNILDSIRLRVKCSSTTAPTSKPLHSSPKSKVQLGSNSEFKPKKKPLTSLTNMMGCVPLNLDKKNYSTVKVNKSSSDKQYPHIKPMHYKHMHNQSSDSNFDNIFNTDMYCTINTMNSVKSDFNGRKKDKEKRKAQNISAIIQSTHQGINNSTRSEYKTTTTSRKIQSSASQLNGKGTNCNRNTTNQVMSKSVVNNTMPDRTIDAQIIDQSFENHLKKDEMICQKTTDNSFDEKTFRSIEDYDALNDAYIKVHDELFLLYDDNYLTDLAMENIEMEVQLYIEKVCELQIKYHVAMKEMTKQYQFYKKTIAEYNELTLKLIKMKSKLAQKFYMQDYKNRMKENTFNSLNNSKLAKDELSFWKMSVEKGLALLDYNNEYSEQKKTKDRLFDIISTVFNSTNSNKTMINQARSSVLNSDQNFFLGKILQKISRKYEDTPTTTSNQTDLDESVASAIEHLKNNLKNKMRPMILDEVPLNSQTYHRVGSQNTLEASKAISKQSMPSIAKQKNKKSESNLGYQRTASNRYSFPKYK